MINQTNPAAEAAKAAAINAEKSTNYAMASITMFKRFENLSIKREVWESNELARSNDALYPIFDGCLELYCVFQRS